MAPGCRAITRRPAGRRVPSHPPSCYGALMAGREVAIQRAAATQAKTVRLAALYQQRPTTVAPQHNSEDSASKDVAALRVLASGSAGNCSALVFKEGNKKRVCLIDLGLSIRRTLSLLSCIGLSLDEVDHVFITHFDGDHFQRAWSRKLPARIALHVHHHHVQTAMERGVAASRLHSFRRETTVGGVLVRPALLSHDEAGVTAYRFEYAGAVVAYATDVGRVTKELAAHLHGADLLAVESNYCPRLQAMSGRPEFLKRRIMGGGGHLSNQQCAELVRQAKPRSDVVLLHLSRDCNRPELARLEHKQATYRLTISSQHEPTGWIGVSPSAALRTSSAGRYPA